MVNTYDIGDLVRVSTGTSGFTDTNSNPYDPAVVKFKFQDPSGNETTYTHGTDAELVKDDTGDYHVDVDADEAGTWFWRWEGETAAGASQAADEGYFFVRKSEF